jgi:hypothetical protein
LKLSSIKKHSTIVYLWLNCPVSSSENRHSEILKLETLAGCVEISMLQSLSPTAAVKAC